MIKFLAKVATKLDELGLTKDADFLDEFISKLAKKDKWMQKAVPKKDAGKFATWCKENGFKGVCQSCINKAAKKGGHAAKMALFAVNASSGKYTYPKTKKKEK